MQLDVEVSPPASAIYHYGKNDLTPKNSEATSQTAESSDPPLPSLPSGQKESNDP